MTKLRIFLADDHAVVREGLRKHRSTPSPIGSSRRGCRARPPANRFPQLSAIVVVWDTVVPAPQRRQAAERSRSPRCGVAPRGQGLPHCWRRGRWACSSAAAEDLVVPHGGGGQRTWTRAWQDRSKAKDAGEEANNERKTARGPPRPAGHSNKAIAGHFELSVKTVETFRGPLTGKAHMRTRRRPPAYAENTTGVAAEHSRRKAFLTVRDLGKGDFRAGPSQFCAAVFLAVRLDAESAGVGSGSAWASPHSAAQRRGFSR